ncbi:DUF4453 domain-containing protein [Gymnodinialimonas hymeniacidonis]|uniref:DUF4453 domain-containing protein n=1 Tax=Gymnodinialimonas hymeniacidonis TaxID=3126508 RepID=UPI0034C6162E
MRLTFIAAVFAILPVDAWAQNCATLWTARNMVYYAAGHCFNSALARDVFSNEGCSSAELTAAEREMIAWVRAREAALGCAINPNSTASEAGIPTVIDRYRGLTAIPFETGQLSQCRNYRGPELAAHTGLRRSSHVIGSPPQGANLYFRYRDFGGWVFVQWDNPDGTNGLFGWVEDFANTPRVCDPS